jgi:hypothetical protein
MKSFDENSRQESFASTLQMILIACWVILTLIVFVFTWQKQHPSDPNSQPRMVNWTNLPLNGSTISKQAEQVPNSKPILDRIDSPEIGSNVPQTSNDKPHNYLPEVAGAEAAIALSIIEAPVAVIVGGGMLVWWLIKKWFL